MILTVESRLIYRLFNMKNEGLKLKKQIITAIIFLFFSSWCYAADSTPLVSGETWGVTRGKINANDAEHDTRLDALESGKQDAATAATDSELSAGLATKLDEPTGTPDGTKFAADDGTWKTPSGSTITADGTDPTKAAVAVLADTATHATSADSATTADSAATTETVNSPKVSGIPGAALFYAADGSVIYGHGILGPNTATGNVFDRYPSDPSASVGQTWQITAVSTGQTVTLPSGTLTGCTIYDWGIVDFPSGSGVSINDGTPSLTTTYSGTHIDEIIGSSGLPNYVTSDPTIASTSGYYLNTSTPAYFVARYGIDVYQISGTMALVDSDTTDPVFVADADTTHDGATPFYGTGDLTESYPASPAVTYSVTNATPASGSCTLVSGSSYTTPELTPDGTDDCVVTFTGHDLYGNTGQDTQTFTYSGGATASYSFSLDAAYNTTQVYDSITEAGYGSGADTVTFAAMSDSTVGAEATGTSQSISLTSETFVGSAITTIYFETQISTSSTYNNSLFYDNGGDNIDFKLYNAGGLGRLYVRSNYGTAATITFTAPTVGAVHSVYIILDWSNSTAANRVLLYIDGSQIDTSGVDMSGIADPGTLGGNLLFPYEPSAGGNTFIRNLKFYDSVVTP